MKKRFLLLAGIGILAMSLVSCEDEERKELTFESRDVDFYVSTSTNKDSIKLYFSEEEKGIPYLEVSDIPTLMNALYGDGYNKACYTVSSEGDNYQVKREASNGSYVELDFDLNTFYCNDREKFAQSTENPYALDATSLNMNFYDENKNVIDGQVKFLRRKTASIERGSGGCYVDFDDYHIDLEESGDLHLIPFTTFYDLMGTSAAAMLYNGYSVFIVTTGIDNTVKDENGKTLSDIYYEHSEDVRSQELINYNYNELCMNLDYSYGLKEGHGITKFDDYFEAYGMKDLFLSANKADTDKAYLMLQTSTLVDNHTGYVAQMPYEGYVEGEAASILSDLQIDGQYWYKQRASTNTLYARVQYGNLDATGAVKNAYQENGDTAIITFDRFLMQTNTDFYYSDDFKNNKEAYINSDTIALVSYAQDKISSNPEIKRVIIDLSGNGGGVADSAAFVLAWLDSGIINLRDAIDGGTSSIRYSADVNFDKTIDDSDYLDSYVSNIYCVTSDSSFSCGNLVPCMLKETGMVKLIGTQSGGGTCVVKIAGLPDGTLIQFSSSRQLCSVKNGSYYDIDQGVTPDYYLADYATLYGGTTTDGVDSGDRENLIKYIESLEARN